MIRNKQVKIAFQGNHPKINREIPLIKLLCVYLKYTISMIRLLIFQKKIFRSFIYLSFSFLYQYENS
jgi:hypothetical protein